MADFIFNAVGQNVGEQKGLALLPEIIFLTMTHLFVLVYSR